MRKTDAMGIERPIIARGDVMHQSMSFPDLTTMRPIRLPRPHLRADSPIYDISTHSEIPPYPMHRIPRPDSSPFVRSRTLPRLDRSRGPYMFPEHLSTRRPEAVPLPNMFNQQLLPEYGNRRARQPINGTITHADQLATDRMPPSMVALAEDRQAYFGENAPQSLRVKRSEQQQDLVPAMESRYDDEELSMRARAITANPYIGYQRFVFTLNKYPAIVMTIVALWNISGRGEMMPKSDTENGAYYTALVTAGIVFASHLLLILGHHYSYKKARRLSYLYHLSMVLAFCAAAVCIVLASINFKNYSDNTSKYGCKYMNNAPCYSNQERVTYLGVLVGCGAMIVLLAISVFMYGGIGLSLMKQRLAEEYAKSASERTYNNHGFQY